MRGKPAKNDDDYIMPAGNRAFIFVLLSLLPSMVLHASPGLADSLGVASSSRPSTADSQRVPPKSLPRATRYRYVVNDLPPALPPPTGDLPPTPPQTTFTRSTSQPVPYTPTSATTTTGSVPFSPGGTVSLCDSQPASPPPRPPRSTSRPAPPSRSATPTPASMLDVPAKQLRRRSRSLGSLPSSSAPPPYDGIVNPRLIRGSPSPAAGVVGGRGRSGTEASAPLSRAAAAPDYLSFEGRAPSPAVTLAAAARSDSPMMTLAAAGRSDSPSVMTLAGDAGTVRRTLRRMSKSLTQLRARSKSRDRVPPSELFRPLVTVIPPMPDKAPPRPDDAPSDIALIATALRAAAALDESSLGRAPPVMQSSSMETDQLAINPPRPAPKPPVSKLDPPSLGKAPLAARDDSAVREQVLTQGLKRVSRSYTNLRVMTTPDALQAEAQATQRLQAEAASQSQSQSRSRSHVEFAKRSHSPRPPRAPAPEPAPIVTTAPEPKADTSKSRHRRGMPMMLPTPPHTPPSPAPIGEQPIPASRKARSRMNFKGMSPVAMMTTFAPRRDSNSSRAGSISIYSGSSSSTGSASPSPSPGWSPMTPRSSSDRERSISQSVSVKGSPPFTPSSSFSSSSHGHGGKASPMFNLSANASASSVRLPLSIPRERERLPPTTVVSPVDPVAASNNRISFLKPAMVRPFMGKRI